MWKNQTKHFSDDNSIPTAKFFQSYEMLKQYSLKTPIHKLNKLSKKINKTVFIKDESQQNTNSFKMRGVPNYIHQLIDKINHDNNITKNHKISFVTQSTGNHGIAMIYTLYLIALKHCHDKFHIIHKINPVVFASKNIGKIKHEKMIEYLDLYRNVINDPSRGNIITTFNDYNDALICRENFVLNNTSYYIPHVSEEILIGHGTIAIEIKNQLLEIYGQDIYNKKICFLAACGAGGPIGIGICFKKIFNPQNINFVIVQTNDQSALVDSLIHNKIVYNRSIDNKLPFNYADGIGVDKPEGNSIVLAQKYSDYAVLVNHYDTLLKSTEFINDLSSSNNIPKKNCKAGGTTVAVYKAIEDNKNQTFINDSDIIIMLGCEGNIDYPVQHFINSINLNF